MTRLAATFALALVLAGNDPPAELPAAAVKKLSASLRAASPHAAHVWRDTPPINSDGTVNAYVEIPRGERRKWEFDMAANRPAVDRVVPEDVGGYPVNYGFVPQTVSYDGDPFDALVLGPPLSSGQLVRGVPVAVMRMQDGGAIDSKVVLSPVGPDGRPSVALAEDQQQRMADYFSRYKRHEPGAATSVPGWGDAAEGRRLIARTHAFFTLCADKTTVCQVPAS